MRGDDPHRSGRGGRLLVARRPARTALADPPDYIGVWVRTTHDSKTGTFFDDMTITKISIYRIQPDIDG